MFADTMPKQPRTTSKKLISALVRCGFFIHRQRGSHAILKHPDGRRTVIAQHAGDIPVGTLSSILKDLHMTVEELNQYL